MRSKPIALPPWYRTALIGATLIVAAANATLSAQETAPRPGAAAESAASTAQDQRIEERLRNILASVPEFASLSLAVQYQVVRLSGDAPTTAARDDAVALASKLDGVLYVVDLVKLDTNIDTRITPLLDRAKSLVNRALEYLPLLAIAIGVFVVFLFAGRLAGKQRWFLKRSGRNALLNNLLRQAARTLIAVIGLLIALDLLGLGSVIGAVVGAAGVIGLAVGFAFKDIIENYLSGVLLGVRSPFAVNDWISVGDIQGSVIRLTTRELILMTLEGNHVRIPNSQVFKSVIYNYTRNPLRGFVIEIGVGPSVDLEESQRVGVAALSSMAGVLEEPPVQMRVHRLGDYNVIIGFYGWVDQKKHDFVKVQSEAMRILKTAFDEAGIEMPEPTQNIRLRRIVPDAAAEEPIEPHRSISAREAAGRADVGRDSHLDRQIENDAASTDETNLLE